MVTTVDGAMTFLTGDEVEKEGVEVSEFREFLFYYLQVLRYF